MVRLHKKLGTEEFPLIDQTFYPNHKEMVSLGEVEWARGGSIMPTIIVANGCIPMAHCQSITGWLVLWRVKLLWEGFINGILFMGLQV